MSRTLTLFSVLVLASVALAGCTMNGDDGNGATTTTTSTPPTGTTTPPTGQVNTTPPLSNASFTVQTSGIPAQVLPGQRFNFTVYVNGTSETTSDHVGAHYANNSTASPSASAMAACEHGAGALPGVFDVACTFDEEGSWHVFGHARGNDTNGTYNWWAAPVEVKVRNYTLNLTNAPLTPPLGGSAFRLRLTVEGVDNVTSDHIGAHWFNETTTTPTVAASAGACAHVNTGVVGVHEIECRIPNAGPAPKTVFVYGHLRIIEGGATLQWWSQPLEVQIGPNPLG